MHENSEQSLVYAALEGRLTLEFLCYERFKLTHKYLSLDDLNKWQPKDVVKQVSSDIDEHIAQGFTFAVSIIENDQVAPTTQKEFESLDYSTLGTQSQLGLNKLHSLWHAMSNVALHIPVPNIASGDIHVYGNSEAIRKKLTDLLKFLSNLKGNMIMGGPLGKVYGFECYSCGTQIQKPIAHLSCKTITNCIRPDCHESYTIEPGDDNDFDITRMVVHVPCTGCDKTLAVPRNKVINLRTNQSLDVICHGCDTTRRIAMRPAFIDT